jgi:hypothetical protein
VDDGLIELCGIVRVTLYVADLDAAVGASERQLEFGPPSRTAQGRQFRLPGVDVELRPAPADGSVPPGSVEVHVGVTDRERAERVLAKQGIAATARLDGLALSPADLNGVRLVLASAGGQASDHEPDQAPYLGISHVVVAVQDADAAIGRWTRLFRPSSPGHANREHAHHIPAGRQAWFGITATGTDSDAIGRFLERRGEGVYAVGVLVGDREQRARRLAGAGARLVQGSGQVFVHPATTHGILVELVPAGSRARILTVGS